MEKQNPKEIQKISKERKKNGTTQYFVVSNDNNDGKGHWHKETDIPQSLIEQYNDSEKNKKKGNKKTIVNTGRRIQLILGAKKIENDLVFVVKFTDSDTFEDVSHSDMKNRYTKSLLSYYEQKLSVSK